MGLGVRLTKVVLNDFTALRKGGCRVRTMAKDFQ